MLAAIVLVCGVPDYAPLFQAAQGLPGIFAFDNAVEIAFASADLQPFPHRVFVEPIHHIDVTACTERLADRIHDRIVCTDQNNATAGGLGCLQVFEPGDRKTVRQILVGVQPGDHQLDRANSHLLENGTHHGLLLRSRELWKTAFYIGLGDNAARFGDAMHEVADAFTQCKHPWHRQVRNKPGQADQYPGRPNSRRVDFVYGFACRHGARMIAQKLEIGATTNEVVLSRGKIQAPCICVEIFLDVKTAIPELPAVGHLHILVVGDVMLDRYWQGPAERISPEAPVPIVAVTHTEHRPGGAANVALNIVSLGAQCTLVGLIGNDEAGAELTATLIAAGVHCDLIKVPDWPTIVKLRLLAQKQQLIRADFEAPLPDFGASERIGVVQNKIEKHLRQADVLVVEDYDKGAIEDPQALIAAAVNASVPVVVDPKMKPLQVYARATLLKPNRKEFAHAMATGVAGKGQGPEQDIGAAGQQLCSELQLGGVIITRGGEGMDLCTVDEVRHIPARPVEVYDVTGAGDTTAAGLAIGLALDWSLLDCARIANLAASIVVSKSGTALVSGPELRNAMQGEIADRGMISRGELQAAVAHAQANGERVVFTNGCFDILHAGHVTYLQEAVALGDRLVVAINGDDSVTRLKGEGRPVVPLEGRSRVLEGLSCVDWVVSFDEDTPIPLLELLKPDVLVKGGDYGPDTVVGADLVRAYGGEVQVLSLVSDVSTSAIVDRIRELGSEQKGDILA